MIQAPLVDVSIRCVFSNRLEPRHFNLLICYLTSPTTDSFLLPSAQIKPEIASITYWALYCGLGGMVESVRDGLDPLPFAKQVAQQLMAHDALGRTCPR